MLLWAQYRPCDSDMAKICANLMLTCKSHKVPTSFRNVHGATGSACLGLATRAEKKIEEQLEVREHLLRSAERLVEHLKDVQMTDST